VSPQKGEICNGVVHTQWFKCAFSESSWLEIDLLRLLRSQPGKQTSVTSEGSVSSGHSSRYTG